MNEDDCTSKNKDDYTRFFLRSSVRKLIIAPHMQGKVTKKKIKRKEKDDREQRTKYFLKHNYEFAVMATTTIDTCLYGGNMNTLGQMPEKSKGINGLTRRWKPSIKLTAHRNETEIPLLVFRSFQWLVIIIITRK
jgi:hypothetical protein